MAKRGWGIAKLIIAVCLAAVGMALLLLAPLVVRADYVDVPNDGSSIQVAIGNADAGDVIRVEAGVFTENLVITKSLTLEGGYNSSFTSRTPRTTVIAPPPGRAISIVGEGITVTIDGFEIRDGDAGSGSGGGIAVDVEAGSSVTITDNFIHDNVAADGGGIYAEADASALIITGNDVMTNTTTDDYAGFYTRVYTGTFVLVDNEIVANASGDYYGGFYADVRYTSTFSVEDNLVMSNTATATVYDDGGGFLFWAQNDSHGTFDRNQVVGNQAGDRWGGGQVRITQNSGTTFDGNVFQGNKADTHAGLYLYVYAGSQVTGAGLQLVDNESGEYIGGGLVSVEGASVTLSSVQVVGNQAGNNAGGLRVDVTTEALLEIDGGYFEDNYAGADGGGLYVDVVAGSTFRLVRSDFFLNEAGGQGGGLGSRLSARVNGHLEMDQVRFVGNETDGDGGGLYLADVDATSSVTMSNSVIEGNTASGDYGGMYANSAGDVIVQTTAISDNVAEGCGGGLGLDGNGMYVLQRNQILENNAGGWCGDGLLVNGLEDVWSENNLIAGNGGSGIYLVDAEIESANDTIAHNQEYGVVMTGTVPSLTELTGCIVWGQSTSLWRSSNVTFDFEVDYCDIQLGWPSGMENIAESPRFVDAAAGDYHLQPNSPALNRLDPAAIYVPTVDLDGNARPYPAGGKADMGCYEAPWESVYLPLVLRD
jgi:hypothetical protein